MYVDIDVKAWFLIIANICKNNFGKNFLFSIESTSHLQ